MSPEPPVRSRRRGKIFWIKLAVTLSAIALIVAIVPWGELWEHARRLDARTWLLVFLGFVVAHLVGAMKWRLNVNVGRAGLGAVDAVRCYFAGLFANLCLPSIVGGDALRAVLAGRRTGRYEAVIFGSLTDRLIDVLALLLLICAGALLSRGAVPGWAEQVLLVGMLVGVGGLVLALPFLLRMPLARWPRKLRRPAARGMVAARRLGRRPQVAVGVLAISLGMQGSFVAMNAALGAAIGIDVPWTVWLLAWPLAKAISLAPISLGGFGVREAALAGLLNAAAAVPSSQGVLVSLVWQTVLVAGGLVGGALWFLLGLRERGAGSGGVVAKPRAVDSKHA